VVYNKINKMDSIRKKEELVKEVEKGLIKKMESLKAKDFMNLIKGMAVTASDLIKKNCIDFAIYLQKNDDPLKSLEEKFSDYIKIMAEKEYDNSKLEDLLNKM